MSGGGALTGLIPGEGYLPGFSGGHRGLLKILGIRPGHACARSLKAPGAGWPLTSARIRCDQVDVIIVFQDLELK